MTKEILLLSYVWLLATHWFADFVCQTNWQALNKSKNNVALSHHVLIYTAILGVASLPLMFGNIRWLPFVLVNGALHFATDYCTSRWSSRLFASAAGKVYADDGRVVWVHFDPHYFFVVIGMDQLIHQITLAVTLWLATK